MTTKTIDNKIIHTFVFYLYLLMNLVILRKIKFK